MSGRTLAQRVATCLRIANGLRHGVAYHLVSGYDQMVLDKLVRQLEQLAREVAASGVANTAEAAS